MKGPSAAAEPGDGDDVRAALELLERRRSSSNGSGLRAAPELLERRRLAGGAGAPRTATACGQRWSSSDWGGVCGRRRNPREAVRFSVVIMGGTDETGRWPVSALSLPPIYQDGRWNRGAVSGNRLGIKDSP